MFEVNDKVVYGVVGVCEIVDINKPPIKGIEGKYYFLQPVYDDKGIIYSPVESKKVMMRYVMSKEDAQKLYVRAQNCKKDTALNEAVSPRDYDEVIKSQDAFELMRLIRTLYNIKNERAKNLRKMKSADLRMLMSARKLLYGELAVSLDCEHKELCEELDAMLGQN